MTDELALNVGYRYVRDSESFGIHCLHFLTVNHRLGLFPNLCHFPAPFDCLDSEAGSADIFGFHHAAVGCNRDGTFSLTV